MDSYIKTELQLCLNKIIATHGALLSLLITMLSSASILMPSSLNEAKVFSFFKNLRGASHHCLIISDKKILKNINFQLNILNQF